MASSRDGEHPPEFQLALEQLRSAVIRPEVQLEEMPAPKRLAPFATALSAEVLVGEDELASGRFVLLYDPDGQEAWQGCFRAVTLARAELEPEIGTDPLLAGVGWSWLLESLAAHGAEHTAPSGTVTRVQSESFGAIAERPPVTEIELRASWTAADGAVGRHLTAWCELLAMCGGLPPVPQGVIPIPNHRGPMH